MKSLSLTKVIFFLFVCLFLEPSYVVAANNAVLNIEPSIFMVNLKQGDLWSSSIKIKNDNQQDISYVVSLVDFKKDEGGSFVPTLDSLRPVGVNFNVGSSNRLSNWIKPSKPKIIVRSNETVDLPFVIEIPEYAEPADYRAAILVSFLPDASQLSGSSLSVSSYVSSILSIKISGKKNGGIKIRQFSSSRLVYENPNITLILELENKDNGNFLADGFVEIKNIFGKRVANIKLNNETDKKTWGGSHSYVLNWEPKGNSLNIGPYIATVTISNSGSDNKPVSSSSLFWIIPIRMILASTLLILISLILGDRLIGLYIRRKM